jgi:hypothetical protein
MSNGYTCNALPFFDLPAAAIDAAAVEAFLDERLPESLNIDYKAALADSVYECIAAMANTYGGVIFVGVAALVLPVARHHVPRDRPVRQPDDR